MYKQSGQTRLHLPSARADGGQVLLIVILVVIVASTVGLSLASRSITSMRSSTEEAESQKALAAAEAGIERAIQGSIPINIPSTNLGNNSSYVTQVLPGNSSSFLINGGNMIPKDEGADVWFVGHNSDGSLNYNDYSSTYPNFLNLYWGSASDGSCSSSTAPAAIQAIIVTRDSSSPNTIKSYRYAYDSCSSQRGNNFTPADTTGSFTVGGITFNYSTPKNDLAKGIKDIILMRVIPIYKDAAIGIDTCNPANRPGCNNLTALPSQGYIISSTGTSGQASRKLTVFKGYPQTYLPYLSYGLFVAK